MAVRLFKGLTAQHIYTYVVRRLRVKEQTEQGIDGGSLAPNDRIFQTSGQSNRSDTIPKIPFLLKLQGLSDSETDGTKMGTHFNLPTILSMVSLTSLYTKQWPTMFSHHIIPC